MRIAVIDDELLSRRMLDSYIKKYASEAGFEVSVSLYETAEEFLSVCNKDMFSIVFMDIELPGIDGMAAARKLRESDENVIIIFVTQMAKYAIDGYEVGAFSYIVKPVAYYDFRMKAGRAVDKVLAKKGRRIAIKNKGESEWISALDVMYVEVSNRIIVYHTGDSSVSSYGTLKEAEKDFVGLPFVRCNNCYLVNLDSVRGVKGLTVTLKNGEALQISSPRRKEFLAALTDYIGG